MRIDLSRSSASFILTSQAAFKDRSILLRQVMLVAPGAEEVLNPLREVRVPGENLRLDVAQNRRQGTASRFHLLHAEVQGPQHLFRRPHTLERLMHGKTQQLAQHRQGLGALEEVRAEYSPHLVGRKERVQERKSRKTLGAALAPGTVPLIAVTTGETAEVVRVACEQAGDLYLIQRPQEAEVLHLFAQVCPAIPAERPLEAQGLGILMVHFAAEKFYVSFLAAAFVGDDDSAVAGEDGTGDAQHRQVGGKRGVPV